MASTDHSATGLLLFARNGANRPLHQDRQVLRAGDLSLEQATQDAMLARARRYLHGWGVVAGFEAEVTESNRLRIGPGYGVTPLGDELFLPEAVLLRDARDATVLCCGPGPLGCDVIDAAALAEAREGAGRGPVTSWLIARPASRDAAPRAAVPEGCAHPATTLLPSRRCGGVEFAILCTLPPSHQPPTPECDALMPFVCGLPRIGGQPLPWENALEPEANFLVIAQLTVTGSTLSADVNSRRKLWPVALIQDWIASCICPLLDRTLSTLDLDRNPSNRTNAISPGGTTPPPPPPSGEPETAVEPAGPELRERLDSSVTSITGIGAAREQLLTAIGVITEGEFLTTPSELLAKVLNLPEAKIAEMKEEISARHNLGQTFR